MKFKALALSLLGFCSFTATADTELDWDFSLATGAPFFAIPQLDVTDENRRYYLNYKAGLDDGFTVGIDWLNGQHAFGIFAGAIGAKNTDLDCERNPQNIGEAIICPAFAVFGHETTQGVGLAYEYQFSTTDSRGWGIRLEAGYGEESRYKTKRRDGNIQLIYRF